MLKCRAATGLRGACRSAPGRRRLAGRVDEVGNIGAVADAAFEVALDQQLLVGANDGVATHVQIVGQVQLLLKSKKQLATA